MSNTTLKEGDELVSVHRSGSRMDWSYSTVASTTDKQAKLENGDILNIHANHKIKDRPVFEVIGHGKKPPYEFITDAITEEQERYAKAQGVRDWFRSYQFTDEQKLMVYDLFNNSDEPA